jgi:hypothetical protein
MKPSNRWRGMNNKRVKKSALVLFFQLQPQDRQIGAEMGVLFFVLCRKMKQVTWSSTSV